MADKQATVYIVDLGTSMGQKRHGRDETDLDYALRYIWDRITTTVSNGRKTDTIGVVGFRTDETDNELAAEGDEAYNNICVLHPIGQMLMPGIRTLKSHFHPSNTDDGDGISAIVIAISMITAYCKHLKYIKKIVLVTNGTAMFDTEGIEAIQAQIIHQKIELTVLGVDFDDAEFGVKEEDKDEDKAENERTLKKFVEAVDGNYGTLAEAIQEMQNPRLKTVRPVASYKGKLMLGDAEKYPNSAFLIDVERYPRTMLAKPVSASSYVVAPDNTQQASSHTLGEDAGLELQAVKNARTYQVDADDEPGGKMEVDRDDLEKGYKYGRTIVPISQTDENITKLETEQGMEIVGFIPAEHITLSKEEKENPKDARVAYKRWVGMSNTNVIVGQKGNELAQMALSSLIHALYELDAYALVRFVKKKDEGPVMMALAPWIEAEVECLIDVQVPFLEDVRPYKFPPLGVVKTTTGKTLDKHRFLPTDDMDRFMSDFVDSMDLDTFGKDEEGEPTEYAAPEDTFSPLVHRINQVIRHRAVHPDAPLPPVQEILLKYSQPPAELIERSQKILDKLIKACDIKKVDQKAKGRRGRAPPQPKSGLDIESLLNAGENTPETRRKKPITLENAIPEFLGKVEVADTDAAMEETVGEMMGVVEGLVKTSVSNLNYARAVEMLGAVKKEMGEMESWGIWNRAAKKLRKKVLAGELGGDRKGFWKDVAKAHLGLFEAGEEVKEGGVGHEEAEKFFRLD